MIPLILTLFAFSGTIAIFIWAGTKQIKMTLLVWVLVVGGSAELYIHLGGWRAIQANLAYERMLTVLNELYSETNLSQDKVEQALDKVSSQLPQNAFLWFRLGEIYEKLGWYQKAKESYHVALELAPEMLDIQLKFAYASSFSFGGELDSQTLTVVEGILNEHPNHPGAVNLLAMDALKKHAYIKAASLWQNLLATAQQTTSQERKAIQSALQKAILGFEADIENQQEQVVIKANVSYEGLQGEVRADLPVFIYAKHAKKSGPPIAALKLRAGDLPAQVLITQEQAMQQSIPLEQGQDIIVIARIAKSSSPIAKAGDLQGESSVVHLSGIQVVNINVNRIVEEG